MTGRFKRSSHWHKLYPHSNQSSNYKVTLTDLFFHRSQPLKCIRLLTKTNHYWSRLCVLRVVNGNSCLTSKPWATLHLTFHASFCMNGLIVPPHHFRHGRLPRLRLRYYIGLSRDLTGSNCFTPPGRLLRLRCFERTRHFPPFFYLLLPGKHAQWAPLLAKGGAAFRFYCCCWASISFLSLSLLFFIYLFFIRGVRNPLLHILLLLQPHPSIHAAPLLALSSHLLTGWDPGGWK